MAASAVLFGHRDTSELRTLDDAKKGAVARKKLVSSGLLSQEEADGVPVVVPTEISENTKAHRSSAKSVMDNVIENFRQVGQDLDDVVRMASEVVRKRRIRRRR